MFWDPEFWPNLDPDPDPRVVLSILRIKVKIFKVFFVSNLFKILSENNFTGIIIKSLNGEFLSSNILFLRKFILF